MILFHQQDNEPLLKIVGRPKGSSEVTTSRNKLKRENAMTEVARRLQLRQSLVPDGSRLGKGSLEDIITDVRSEFNVSEIINMNTIRGRLRRKSLNANSILCSPLQKIEKYIAETIIQLAKIKKPLTTSGCIQLANSMIDSTTHQKKIIIG